MRFKQPQYPGQTAGTGEINGQAVIGVDVKRGEVSVAVFSGDDDGDGYTIYVPNHRDRLEALIKDLREVLDATKDWTTGYDGISTNACNVVSTPEAKDDEGTSWYEAPGTVSWY